MAGTPDEAESGASLDYAEPPMVEGLKKPNLNPRDMERMMEMFFTKLFDMNQSSSSKIESSYEGKISFNLAKYDPSKSAYAIEEWLKDVKEIRRKTNLDDQLFILKASEALEGKAKRFIEGWRPLVRDWATFEEDLMAAFPDHETWHQKLLRAANMKSSDFDSISEYGIEKIRSLHRYYAELPWDRVLSPVIGGISSSAIREGIRLHQPKNQKELMILLRQYEAENENCERNDIRPQERPTKRPKMEQSHQFMGKCFNCGKSGHKKSQCRGLTTTRMQTEPREDTNLQPTVMKCTFCQRVGHTITTCYKKNLSENSLSNRK